MANRKPVQSLEHQAAIDAGLTDAYHWCEAHKQITSEGDICAECERLGQRELDLCKRVHPALNNDFVRYYVNGPQAWSNRRWTLREIAWNTWQIGKDQALLEAMIRGFSLCVAKPVIDEIHDRMDADYEAYQAEQDRQLIEDGHPDLVRKPQTF